MNGEDIALFGENPHTGDSLPVHKSHHRVPSSGAVFEDAPRLIPTPWELERHKKGLTRKRTRLPRQLPARIFKTLPREVYDCIVEQLEQVHLGQDQSCPSCYLRDMYNLSLTSRAWDRATTSQLYRSVWVLGRDHHSFSILKIMGTRRLKLLRRTLRERQTLAKLVRELYMPDFQALYYDATIEKEAIVNLVASLVMSCPNLERLIGFHIPYTHSFDRLSYALSTRPMLKERVWHITENHMAHDEEDNSSHGYYHAAGDPTERFLELNSNYFNLSILLLHRESSSSKSSDLAFRAIIGTIRQLPALRHLSISGFSSTSFSNITLNALPPDLQSLRLENLPGVTDRGLLRFSTSYAAVSLASLTLINLEITNLTTISNFLRPHLARLVSFTLAQYGAPSLPRGISLPILQSPTLKSIHWELRSQAGPPPSLSPRSSKHQTCLNFPFTNDEPIPCLATSLLAKGIREGDFPSLIRIRAPHDPQGTLQALCKPLGTVLLPLDSALFTSLSSVVQPPLPDLVYPYPPASMMTSSKIKGHGRNQLPVITSLTPTRSRLAAEARILSTRKKPLTTINVHDPSGSLTLSETIASYLGDVNSNITYDLKPDRNFVVEEVEGDGDDEKVENQWITGITDVMGKWEVVERKNWGTCGHRVDGRVGKNSVNAGDMF
ncbi:hypothetical protein P280DRAFT_391358 [Massarina eburnea CBS 473.64]|uniref:F-box domain-containing protein n=1 Tax=Massarina eburnea CBS 473.64 TaxID=1395130 RepID=A0A6A6SB89_9PLEO|nr:hypothetical protein P280DRAFT_391358 [Massarina eburnea CBS 473.64]